MHKFKVGDKVRVIEGGYGIHPSNVGKITTILVVNNSPFYRYTTKDFGRAGEESFELVNSEDLKPKEYGIVKFLKKYEK
jgi:hypothetical protein